MQRPLSYLFFLLGWSALLNGHTEAAHILGLFVNVHRSQLLIHLAVARLMLKRGHQLTLITSLPIDEDFASHATQLRHILIPWQPPAEQEVGSSDVLSLLQRMYDRLEQSGEFLEQPTWLDFLAETPLEHYDLLLLGYHFNDHLLGVAAHFDCPVVIISTQQPISFVHSLMGNPEERYYVPQPYDSQQSIGIAGVLFGLWEKSTELMARRVMRRIYSQHFPSPRYPSFEQMRRRVVLALNNHHMLSEGPIAPLLPSMLDIGGIHMEQQSNIVSTKLQLDRPYIYFSLGTRVSWATAPSHFIEAFLKAFAQLKNYDIYWTFDGDKAIIYNSTYSHLKLSKWLPQQQLLASSQIRLFITHGGKGSLTEALYHGVPMLGLPLIGDQRANLKKMVRRGWGLVVPIQNRNVSSETLLKVLRELLDNSQYSQRIKDSAKLYRDRPLNVSELTSYWLEYVIRYKGATHLYSTARELNTWQYLLLDVYIVIFGTLALLIAATIWLEKRLDRGKLLEKKIKDLPCQNKSKEMRKIVK